MIDIFTHYTFLLIHYLVKTFNEMEENYDMGSKNISF